MTILDLIRSAPQGQDIATLARTFDVPPEQAEAAVAAVIPAFSRGIERASLSRGGLADLMRLVDAQQRLPAAQGFKGEGWQQAGIDALSQILGSKDASRRVAQQAAASSGLSDVLIKQMLPYIAPMIIAAIAKGLQGGLGGILSKIPGLGGGPASFPSAGGSPLPLPGGPPSRMGGNVPYGDLAGDVLKRGSGSAGILRQILGSLFGFSTRGGIVGGLIRLLVLRYGWGILRFVLGRLFRR
jgi:hypothetical protein